MPGTLHKYFISEGTKFLTQFYSEQKYTTYRGHEYMSTAFDFPLQLTGSISTEAAMCFTLRNVLKSDYEFRRVSEGAPLYLFGIIKYIVKKVLECTLEGLKNSESKVVIDNFHIGDAIKKDPSFRHLFMNAILNSETISVFPSKESELVWSIFSDPNSPPISYITCIPRLLL